MKAIGLLMKAIGLLMKAIGLLMKVINEKIPLIPHYTMRIVS